jgi:hypothetical protein
MFDKQAPKEQLAAILDALAESLLEASDEHILEEAAEAGEDIKETETRVKNVFRRAAKSFKKKRLQEARAIYEKETRPARKHHLIPASFQEKLDLLAHIIEAQPQIKAVLTSQYREFTELAEEDVDSYLDELAKLGVLDELHEEKND